MLHAVSLERCGPPEDILYGNITYINEDSSNVLVGDVITYSCDPGAELQGPSERFCLRTGNWSGDEPACVFGKYSKIDLRYVCVYM